MVGWGGMVGWDGGVKVGVGWSGGGVGLRWDGSGASSDGAGRQGGVGMRDERWVRDGLGWTAGCGRGGDGLVGVRASGVDFEPFGLTNLLEYVHADLQVGERLHDIAVDALNPLRRVGSNE